MPRGEGDPRPLFGKALAQAEHLACAVGLDELGNSTPCAEYDVRALLGHLVAVVGMIAHIGAGGDSSDAPKTTDGVRDDGWANAFGRARAEVERVWSDDEVLDRRLSLPWATLPGRAVLDAYTHELTVHSWDLAYATDRLAPLDPDLAARALEWFAEHEPAQSRDEHGTFGPVVPVADDADVYTRLAAYTGRRP